MKVKKMNNPSTLKELAIEYAKKQPHQVDYLTEESPILERMKWEQASHGLWNVYDEVKGIEGADFVDMDAPLPKMSIDTALKKVDLGIMGGIIEVGEDKAQMMGGAAKYFAKNEAKFLRDAGSKTEKKILYDNFRRYAIDNENCQNAGGASGDNLYSILCVHYTPGETTGLYSPDGFKNGAMLDVQSVNNGALYLNKNGVLVKGIRYKGYFGMQLANPKSVSAIANVSKDHIPTENQLDDMLIAARAKTGSTFIYMHPKALSMLNKYKGDILRTVNGDKEINRQFTYWNGIEIITSYNFMDGGETVVENL